MSDTLDDFKSDPSSVPPLARAICATFPTTMAGNIVGPVASDKALRATLDALAALEIRVTTLEGS